jgi:hypothetical protein
LRGIWLIHRWLSFALPFTFTLPFWPLLAFHRLLGWLVVSFSGWWVLSGGVVWERVLAEIEVGFLLLIRLLPPTHPTPLAGRRLLILAEKRGVG